MAAARRIVSGDRHELASAGTGSLDAAEPFTYVAGLLLDDEAAEFRGGFGEISES